MNRRDIFKVLPIAALIPSTAKSVEELEKKLDNVKAKYLILVNPGRINIEDFNFPKDSISKDLDIEIWAAHLDKEAIQIFKLE